MTIRQWDAMAALPDDGVAPGLPLLRDVTAAMIDALLGVAGPDVHSSLMVCELRQMGGALRRGPAAGNAVGGRDADYSLVAIGILTPETAQAAPAAVDAVIAAAEPWSTGHTLVNLHGTLGNQADRARAWDAPTYRRLLTCPAGSTPPSCCAPATASAATPHRSQHSSSTVGSGNIAERARCNDIRYVHRPLTRAPLMRAVTPVLLQFALTHDNSTPLR